MQERQIKKEKRSLVVISATNCSGDFEEEFLYDPKKKTIIEHQYNREKTINQKFDNFFEYGKNTSDSNFHLLCQTIPAFKTRWKDLEKTLKPKFAKGDFVIHARENGESKFTLKSPVWTVGDIIGWSQYCSTNKGTGYNCVREFHRCDNPETKTLAESDVIPAENIEKLEVANKVVLKFKKELKAAGIKNASLNFMGKAYRV